MRHLLHRLRRSFAPFPFEEPIFILAPPRSGSTFLFECLSRFQELQSLNHEADGVWWDLFPYDRKGTADDHVSEEEATPKKVQSLRTRLYLSAVAATASRRNAHPADLGHRLGVKPLMYLDKTIANCFHLSVLQKGFPDARYLLLIRDPRANISSMIEGWPHVERFGKPQLTDRIRETPEATVEHWTYPAPPGWEEQLPRPLPEICAWSWKQHVNQAFDFVQDAKTKSLTIRYEDLRDETRATIHTVANTFFFFQAEDGIRVVR